MYFLMKNIIFMFILYLSTASDPWDVVHKKNKVPLEPWESEFKDNEIFESQKPVVAAPVPSGLYVGDTFYKKLIQLIISRGRFNERDDGIVEGVIHFEFPSSKFELIKEITSKKEPLTPTEYRKADGLFTEHVLTTSLIREFAEKLTERTIRWLQNYHIHILLCILLCLTIRAIYYIDWSKLQYKVVVVGIVVTSAFVWEMIVAFQEAEYADFVEFQSAVKSCNIWNFFGINCEPMRNGISNYWHIFHPLKIIGNVFSKFILNNMTLLLSEIDIHVYKISNRLPPIINNIIYVILSVIIFGFIILLAIATFFNVVLNRPFSFNFLLFNFDFKQKKSRNTFNNQNQSSDNQLPNVDKNYDSLSGKNLDTFLSIIQNKVTLSPVENDLKEGADINTNKISKNKNREKILNRPEKEKIVPHGKMHKRVASMPDDINQLGGGDSLVKF